MQLFWISFIKNISISGFKLMYDVCLHASSRVRVSDLHAPHKVYEERANQKPLTREDGLHAKRLLLANIS